MKPDGGVLLVFTKAPVPGRVNRRLIPTLGEEVAAELYLELLRRTMATATAGGIDNVQLHCTPDTHHPEFARLAAEFDVTLHTQHGRDLGKRMHNALYKALQGHRAAVLVGCDTPELSTTDLKTAYEQLYSGYDAVLGPAEDGGYYLIGLSRACPDLFEGVQWGQGEVLVQTRQHLNDLGLSYYELSEHWDVDRPQDVLRYRERFETRINLVDKKHIY